MRKITSPWVVKGTEPMYNVHTDKFENNNLRQRYQAARWTTGANQFGMFLLSEPAHINALQSFLPYVGASLNDLNSAVVFHGTATTHDGDPRL